MVIDAHAHLGDVLEPDGEKVIGQGAVNRRLARDPVSFFERFGPLLGPAERLFTPLFRKWVIRAEQARSASATLANLGRSMEENGISKAVLLPIWPNVRFEDIAGPAREDPRLIPFTSIHKDIGDAAPEKIRADIEKGARGIKLHAIIQKLAYTSPLTFAVLEEAQAAGVPVLFHAGRWSYYPEGGEARERPDLAAADYARKMIASFPKIRFIAGHSGLWDLEAFRQALAGLPNVWMETSFASPPAIRGLVDSFGPERVIYGSDWPFGNMGPALAAVRSAFKNNRPLLDRILSENARDLLEA